MLIYLVLVEFPISIWADKPICKDVELEAWMFEYSMYDLFFLKSQWEIRIAWTIWAFDSAVCLKTCERLHKKSPGFGRQLKPAKLTANVSVRRAGMICSKYKKKKKKIEIKTFLNRVYLIGSLKHGFSFFSSFCTQRGTCSLYSGWACLLNDNTAAITP